MTLDSMKRPKLFIVRKYVYAHSVAQAVKEERNYPVEDVYWADEDKQNHTTKEELGFRLRK